MLFGDLDVADVSGLIAAAVTVVQIAIPLALPVVLLGILKEEKANATTASAVSWTVIGGFLHSSQWPSLLSADSASTKGVPRCIVLITSMKTIFAVLTWVAAIVTPLGLYESIVEDSNPKRGVSFHYVKDPSVFGLGTRPRADLPWSRVCGASNWVVYGSVDHPVECPNSFSNVTIFSNETGDYPIVHKLDSHVPQYVIDVFQSGLENMEDSVSSIFDIQARSYSWQTTRDNPDNPHPDAIVHDNGKPYPRYDFYLISSNLLANDYLAIEGLVVDMKNGGIGFRNHSVPPKSKYGSTWSEDLLFIEPESQCVDTNLTFDFNFTTFPSSNRDHIDSLVLTDRGGFANLNLTRPNATTTNAQSDPRLWDRAYEAAWINNVLSMVFMNVTDVRNISDPNRFGSFNYLDSHVGKQFPMMNKSHTFLPMKSPDVPVGIRRFGLSYLYGYYLDGLDFGERPLYKNHFNVGVDHFDLAASRCTGQSGHDNNNINDLPAACGLVYGIARRVDKKNSSLVFELGSSWTVPLYSCITAVKATIKRVTFKFNGTDNLSSLKVTEIADKVYPNETAKPLWGVERSDRKLEYARPLWGLISDNYKGNVSLHTLRQESLYLPAYEIGPHGIAFNQQYQNLPGIDFYARQLVNMFGVAKPDIVPDYSWPENLATLQKWLELSSKAETTSKILNLIWTDLASNSVVGTRGLHGARVQPSTAGRFDDAFTGPASNPPPVTFMRKQIRYHWEYAVPALVDLSFAAAILLATVIFGYLGRVTPRKIRRYLNKTSQGRILTTYIFGGKGDTDSQATAVVPHTLGRRSTKKWVQIFGKIPVTVADGESYFLSIEMGPQNSQAPLLAGSVRRRGSPDAS
ncbi:hypothetical protein VTN49DRAFT_2994 [Thermomyces lanuginosus]|uniref:uncharacterized protein n=1 Tax=Thermomyces lanuginosus TaxID=5541 RepID=UPI003741FCD8